ncbi:TetR/AcrR family transcriptional regulator [Phreatobacter stygius]|uniref:TetR/AcrR family transcriptional regulator n=1 Tax=Phreatobacter stygius TaxID=1940610 RepID=UPI0014777A17|nr:TetR/AcrR family transcriptional regulator [Phreatobacter stygius]
MLDAARVLFAAHGYDAVSMDMIAAEAGIAKGAVYHHFAAKRDVFERVLDTIQANVAVALAANRAPVATRATARSIARSVGAYLDAALQPAARRILLVDGPVVLGWQRWREIDDRYFAAGIRRGVASLMPEEAKPAEREAVTRLVMGAIMEAALACGEVDDPHAIARDFVAALEKMLSGVQSS